MRLLTSDEMRAADLHAIEKVGIPSLVLMENAGVKALFTIEKILSGLKNHRFCIVCGKGNNGGDGLVIARHLLNHGVPVYVFLLAEPDKLSRDARVNLDVLVKMQHEYSVVKDEDDLNRLRIAMEFSDCIVDSIFGTGFSGELTGFAASVIQAMNDSRALKFSIDLPSGLCATTGRLSSACFYADYTITLGAAKLGLFIFPGKKAAGEVWVADIGIPEISFAAAEGKNYLLARPLVESLLAPRDEQMHKGKGGKVLILAGSDEYQGAGVLSSYGALRSGAGIVNLALPESLKESFCAQVLPETIISWLPARDGGFNLDPATISNFAGRFRSLLIGPGWGRGEQRKKSVEMLLEKWPAQLILDADALNAIDDPALLQRAKMVPVITPHLGEMARLCQKTIEEVADDAPALIREFALKNQTIVVLKSSVTLIADHQGRIFVSSRPNSGLARGGSGDLLAGLIAGLAATPISALNAALAGVQLLADAAEAAVLELGEDSVTVSEIAAYLPRAFKTLRGNIDPDTDKNR